MYYLYCLCKSVQRSLVSRLLFFSESGCKGKNFKAYLPNIFGSFFYFSFFLFPRRLSCRKGGKKKKEEKKNRSPFLERRMSTRAAFVFKSGCKGKGFILNCQIFRKFFFGLRIFYSKTLLRKGKKEPTHQTDLFFANRTAKITNLLFYFQNFQGVFLFKPLTWRMRFQYVKETGSGSSAKRMQK